MKSFRVQLPDLAIENKAHPKKRSIEDAGSRSERLVERNGVAKIKAARFETLDVGISLLSKTANNLN